MIVRQNLGQIRPNVVRKKVEKQALSICFFHISHTEYLLKQKIVVEQILEWKFKANIARNAIFEGHPGQHFCPTWVKNGKKGCFHTSHLTTNSVLKSHSFLTH